MIYIHAVITCSILNSSDRPQLVFRSKVNQKFLTKLVLATLLIELHIVNYNIKIVNTSFFSNINNVTELCASVGFSAKVSAQQQKSYF